MLKSIDTSVSNTGALRQQPNTPYIYINLQSHSCKLSTVNTMPTAGFANDYAQCELSTVNYPLSTV